MATQKARFLRRGDVIRYTSGDAEVEEVIREVVIVLRMANGESLSVSTQETYEVIPPEEIDMIEDEADEPSILGDTDGA